MEAEVEKVTAALADAKKQLSSKGSEIKEKDAGIRELERRSKQLNDQNKTVEEEIKAKLNIKDYATETSAALIQQQERALSLEKESDEKAARIALADTVTAFLNGHPYELSLLSMYVEGIKKRREQQRFEINVYPIDLTEDEKRVQTLALGAFKGLLVPKRDYDNLEKEKRASDEAKAQAEKRRLDTEKRLESETNEKQLLLAIKTEVDGQTKTIGELKNWVLKTFNEEIEKKAKEKYNATAAAMHGLIDFAASGIERWAKNRPGGGQH